MSRLITRERLIRGGVLLLVPAIMLLLVGSAPVASMGDDEANYTSVASVACVEDEGPWTVGGCSGIMALGRTTRNNINLSGQNMDVEAMYGTTRTIRLVVNKETGIKVIGGKEEGMIGLNSCGVGSVGLGRSGMPGMWGSAWTYTDKDEAYTVERCWMCKDFPDVDTMKVAKNLLEYAHTAKEAADMMMEGLPDVSGGGYHPSGGYVLRGPMRDVALGQGNCFMAPSLRLLEKDRAYSLYRAQRAQELLDARSWGPQSERMKGEITPQYFFSILRDEDLYPERDGTYYIDERGNIARWGYVQKTCYALFCEIPKSNADLLSIYWTTPNYPVVSPFIPFFIGLPKIPPTFSDNYATDMYVGEPEVHKEKPSPVAAQTNQTEVFQELFNALTYNTDRIPEVRAFWEGFEHRTLREMAWLKKDVRDLMKDGKRQQAEALLYEFTNKKCLTAIAYAKELTQKIVDESLVEVDVSCPQHGTD